MQCACSADVSWAAPNAALKHPLRWSRPRLYLWLLMFLLNVGFAGASQPQWRRLAETSTKPARVDSGMAYDSARGTMVLYGGLSFDDTMWASHGDTWERRSGSWEEAVTWGPGLLEAPSMAYDAARNVVVMFGGIAGTPEDSVEVGDTWVWDGDDWLQKSTTGPSPRSRAAMAFDSARGKMILFGGSYYADDLNLFNDTWEWDGSSWSRVATTGPSPRNAAAMAYDSQRDKIVLFGGHDENGTLADTWEWNGSKWTPVQVSGPSGRCGAAIAYDASRGKTVLFGGGSERYAGDLGDTWEYDGQTWRETGLEQPLPRDGAMIAYDSRRKTVFLYGGFSAYGDVLSDSWEWDGVSWRAVQSGAGPRSEAALAYDAARGKTVLFGGTVDDAFGHIHFGDTWEWDGSAWANVSTTGPVPRMGPVMAYTGETGQTILFGGVDYRDDTFFRDTWRWDGAQWALVRDTGPPGRYAASLAYDSHRARAVLFGGYNERLEPMFLGDTWEWDGSDWLQVASAGPSPRDGAAMAYDSVRRRTVLFGGGGYTEEAGNFSLGDTWEWDGTSWMRVATTGPSARTGASMVFDAARGRTVLFGGGTYAGETGLETFGDTWEWNGTSWTRVEVDGPDQRVAASMVYDTRQFQTILFGGTARTDDVWINLGDTWAYRVSALSYTFQDAATALRYAGGLQVSGADLVRLDVETSETSAGRVDFRDACRIARKVAGLEANP